MEDDSSHAGMGWELWKPLATPRSHPALEQRDRGDNLMASEHLVQSLWMPVYLYFLVT